MWTCDVAKFQIPPDDVVESASSCTSSLRIILSPENQVASLRFTAVGGGTRDGARPDFSRTSAAWNALALCEPDLGLATATRHAIMRARRRSHANQPFPGFIHEPSCATCEARTQEQVPAPPAALLPMLPIRGCPWTTDSVLYCSPTQHCDYYGQIGVGNVRANGAPNGRRRNLQSVACGIYFLEIHVTPVHGIRVAPELVVWAVGALAEGLGI